MKAKRQVALLAATAASFALVAVSLPGRDIEPQFVDGTVAPLAGTLLIDVADHLSERERAEFLATLPGEPTLNSLFSQHEGLYRLAVSSEDAAALLPALRTNDAVEFVEMESEYESLGAAAANDPLLQFQWHFDAIGLEDAWDNADGSGAVVAVIDTGVAFADVPGQPFRRVQDLEASRMVPGYDFVSDDDQPHDEHGHGTHVAGTVAQTTNNAYGGAGIAPNARIMPIRVLDASGRGNTADIAESIRWAADNGADIINMSLGGPLPSRIMQDAVAYAHNKGVTVIAAAGNNGWARPSYPAAYRNVVAVAATQFDGSTTFYSNFGNYIDIAAPGGNTRVDQNNDGRPDGVLQETLSRGNPAEHEFALYMGTSMASPHVAGVAALIHELGVTHPDRVEEMLKSSATQDVPAYQRDRFGAGSLRADVATQDALTRFQTPRAAFAFLLSILTLSFAAGSRRGARLVSAPVAAGVAVFAASGLSLFAWIATTVGLDASGLAPFANGILRWPAALGLSGLASSAVLLSAIPVLGVYAVFGSVRGRITGGVLVGLMAGLAAFLGAEALAPMTNVVGVPGVGGLDQLWLALNAAVALFAAFVAARRA